jgi:hypothetical protein
MSGSDAFHHLVDLVRNQAGCTAEALSASGASTRADPAPRLESPARPGCLVGRGLYVVELRGFEKRNAVYW